MIAGDIADQLLQLIEDEGNCLDSLGRRIVANRLIEKLREWSPPRAEGTRQDKPEPMTNAESVRVGNERMKFGKFQGERIDDVDRDYLEWLADSSKDLWKKLSRYLASERVRAEANASTPEVNELSDWDDL